MNREKVEVYEKELSSLLEIIALNFIDCPPTLDGIEGLTSKIRKKKQIVFEGKVWILDFKKGEWSDYLETFGAIVTDKRITMQGIWIKIWVGDYFGEGNLLEVFG